MKRLIRECGQHRAPRGARERRGQQAKRAAFVVMLGAIPVIGLAWSAGCSDSSEDGAGGNFVDPGGTYGAEITLTVLGRGRVTSSMPGIDCPSRCFAKYIFPNASADGAAAGVTLTAQPTQGYNFRGWTFETEPIGTRGRGPEQCNPVTRPAVNPGATATALEINLPFGEVDGTPPPGKEGECAGYRTVPTVYKLTANFDTEEPDAGADAGPGEIVYEPPSTGVTGLDVGIASGKLFWLYSTSLGYHGIAYGGLPTSSAIPQLPAPIVSPTQPITQFEVDPVGVAFQDNAGVHFISATGSPTTYDMVGNAGYCDALAVDAAQNVYCRTFNAIVRWLAPGYTLETLYTSVAYGTDLHVDGSTIYYSTSAGIYALSVLDGDGGIAEPNQVVPTSPGSEPGVESSTSYLWWVQPNGLYSCPKVSCLTPTNTTSTVGATDLAPSRMAADTSSLYFWAASPTTIYHAYYGGGASTTVFRSGLTGVGGVAADSTYVYWTQADGSVRRAPKGI